MRAAQCLVSPSLPLSPSLYPSLSRPHFNFMRAAWHFYKLHFPIFLSCEKYELLNRRRRKTAKPETKVKEKQLQTSSAITPAPAWLQLQVNSAHLPAPAIPFPLPSPLSCWTMCQPFAVCFMGVAGGRQQQVKTVKTLAEPGGIGGERGGGIA